MSKDKQQQNDQEKRQQEATDQPSAEEQTGQGGEGPWEDVVTEERTAGREPRAASGEVFQPLGEDQGGHHTPRDLDIIMDIPVKLSVELGRTRITIKQLLELAQGSVVELDGLAGEPMDIMINGYLIAQGEVVVLDDKYGIRVTEIITPAERVQKINR